MEQVLAGHLAAARDAEQAEHRRREIAELAAVAQLCARERDDERHGVRRVRSVRRAVGLEHLLGVAVVGGDERDAPGPLDGREDHAERGVGGLDAAITAGSTPECPTMSGFARLTTANA